MTSDLQLTLIEDIKTSMKSGDQPKLEMLRMMLSALKQAAIDSKAPVSDAQAHTILSKLRKQHEESKTQWLTANRPDDAQAEQFRIDLISSYLPQPLSSEKITTLVKQTIESLDAQSPSDMGKVMKYLKSQLNGRCDLAIVSKIVQDQLNSD